MKYASTTILSLILSISFSQSPDSLWEIAMKDIVVASTKTNRTADELAGRVEILTKVDITRSNAANLAGLLNEAVGLKLVDGFGSGIQMQGLDPDYTLIMVDGVPLIGRNGGVLDLERVPLENVERIEVVKGPYSSLYGTDALAGVINVITATSDQKTLSVGSQIQDNGRKDIRAGATMGKNGWHSALQSSWTSSNGYSYYPESGSYTGPPYRQYNLSLRNRFRPSEEKNWRVDYTYFREKIDEKYEFNLNPVVGFTKVDEHRAYAGTEQYIHKDWKFEIGSTYSRYKLQTVLKDEEDLSVIDSDHFLQQNSRTEVELSWFASNDLLIHSGAGLSLDWLSTNRYAEDKSVSNFFFYTQADGSLGNRVQWILGARLDQNDLYGWNLTENVQLTYKWDTRWKTSFRYGSGFKAPDFRHLFLTYTNSTVGYTIVGQNDLAAQMEKFTQQGIIQDLLVHPLPEANLQAEQSHSFSFNLYYRVPSQGEIRFSVFHNDLRSVIETLPVARKTNGQFVYTYENLDRIYTRGFEFNNTLFLHSNLQLDLGYQFLQARDTRVLEGIDEGEYFERDPETLETRRIERSDYGGLFNRSAHSGNLKATFSIPAKKTSIHTSLHYRGKYGLADVDGNKLLNLDQEYVKGYATWHLGATSRLGPLEASLGIRNILDFRNERQIPTEEGRILWLRLNYQITLKK